MDWYVLAFLVHQHCTSARTRNVIRMRLNSELACNLESQSLMEEDCTAYHISRRAFRLWKHHVATKRNKYVVVSWSRTRRRTEDTPIL